MRRVTKLVSNKIWGRGNEITAGGLRQGGWSMHVS